MRVLLLIEFNCYSYYLKRLTKEKLETEKIANITINRFFLIAFWSNSYK
jgi:hypothetical protein